ncbi:glycerophosphoryl diester phosphodiesterase membrane domain-containing protein [Companilactobacillus furfuricola]|uniref:glycerophosphoryl diester phosphodiesterase membrane domain-containing protein n=1 Tax=Companilactobacillus furfuricola TaxID=1462575 RepID=UPI000F7A89B2|nr:glycerophosphodiester phosphodiesterase [Companilactobacillus furfuricola]
MESFRKFRSINQTFWHQWWSFGQILIIVDILINLVFVPLLRVLTEFILDLNNIAYISYTNILKLLLDKPWAILELLILLLLILMIVFMQFSVIFISYRAIRSEVGLGWKLYLRELKRMVWPIPFKTFGFFLLYFLLILPFSGIGLYTPLLDKVQVPQFITDWLFQEHLPWGILLMVIYTLILYIGVRWIFVLPEMIFDQRGARVAIRHSWRITKHHTWHYVIYIAILTIIVSLLSTILFFVLIGLQWLLDFIPAIAKSAAIVNLTLIQIINATAGYYFTAMIALLMISKLPDLSIPAAEKKPNRRWPWFLILGIAVFGFATYGGLYFNNLLMEKPVTVSHRGVDDHNGVQNTISALKTTAKEKPDYIEMDVQETKDHKFIVLHDNTLKNLAGINKGPKDLTLAQLKKIRVYENGQSENLASFSDYLKQANKLDQKLLVEFKRTPSTKADFVDEFSKKYGKDLEKNHAMIHSLDYNFIQDSRKQMPKIPANYILSFNLSGVPRSKATSFTMEATTLNDTFIEEAHFERKKVYAWTVNDPDTMDKMMFIDTDGIVTDNLTTLQKEITKNFDSKSYATRMLNYLITLQDPTK